MVLKSLLAVKDTSAEVKNLPATAEDTRDSGLVPRRDNFEGQATPSSCNGHQWSSSKALESSRLVMGTREEGTYKGK